MSDAGLLVIGLVILTGVVGVLLPVIPGAMLVAAAIVIWAFEEGTNVAWLTVG
ncbi:MAG: DUF456 domain-containing protein, partial [Nocardioidaceae bacterium]|nr:DUF456 domain-containing protein [Nocardioidaceae bacterium]